MPHRDKPKRDIRFPSKRPRPETWAGQAVRSVDTQDLSEPFPFESLSRAEIRRRGLY
jgi:hypothetical protein